MFWDKEMMESQELRGKEIKAAVYVKWTLESSVRFTLIRYPD
jgi:hypothetical protein